MSTWLKPDESYLLGKPVGQFYSARLVDPILRAPIDQSHQNGWLAEDQGFQSHPGQHSWLEVAEEKLLTAIRQLDQGFYDFSHQLFFLLTHIGTIEMLCQDGLLAAAAKGAERRLEGQFESPAESVQQKFQKISTAGYLILIILFSGGYPDR